MKSAIVALLATAAACQSSEIETVNISVNKTQVEDLVNDSIRIHQLYKEHTREQVKNLRQAYADAYKNTAAKIILNFGKTIPPVLEKIASVYELGATNDECNQDCAV